MIFTKNLPVATRGNCDLIEINDPINQFISENGVKTGVAVVFSPATTCSVTTMEYEPGCISDFKRTLDKLIDPGAIYAHNARWEDGNGCSHIRASIFGPSVSIPVIDGRMALGVWQSVVVVDFDVRPRSREIIVQVMAA